MALPSKLDARLRKKFLPQCRLKAGQIWEDPVSGHRLGCLDATQGADVARLMMREFGALKSRSFITLRNQRGYGTQKNWMSVRQELLYYAQGNPSFHVQY